jgi:hypothetical protein
VYRELNPVIATVQTPASNSGLYTRSLTLLVSFPESGFLAGSLAIFLHLIFHGENSRTSK